MARQSYPLLDPIKDKAVRDALIVLWGKVNGLQGVEVAGPFRAPLDHGGFKGINAADPEEDQDVVTLGYADAHYGPAAIQQALQIGGSKPLSLFSLPGSGGGSGIAGTAAYGTHAERNMLNIATLSLGTVFFETDRGSLYQVENVSSTLEWVYMVGCMLGTFDPDTRPSDLTTTDEGFQFYAADTTVLYAWDGASWYLRAQAAPFSGTLDPDTKPTLGSEDTGFLFYATDFNRVYAWGGAAWGDAPGEDDRLYVVDFADTPEHAGWALCDGGTADMSTAAGGTTSVSIPDLTSDNRFRRANTSVGGVGGDAVNHTHDVTVTNNLARAMGGGAPDTVATQTVTSTVPSGTGGDDALPPYMDFLPYIRL